MAPYWQIQHCYAIVSTGSNPNPIPNPTLIPNRIPNVTVSLTPSQPNAKPDARANKYLAVVHNYCSTKTTHLQAEHKYTTKANRVSVIFRPHGQRTSWKLRYFEFSIPILNPNPIPNPACQIYDRRDRYDRHYYKKMTGHNCRWGN